MDLKEITFVEQDSESIFNFDIRWYRGDVTISKTDSKEIKFIIRGFEMPKAQDEFTYELNDGTFKIVANNKEFFSYVENQRAKMNLDILLSEREYTSFTYNTTNGSCRLSDLKIKSIETKTVNGSLTFENSKIVDLKNDTVNGSIRLRNTTVDNIFKLKSVNGSIDVACNKIPENLEMNIINGSITLKIPENDGFKLKKHNRGCLNSDFNLEKSGDMYTYKNGSASLNISNVNGSINILKLDE